MSRFNQKVPAVRIRSLIILLVVPYCNTANADWDWVGQYLGGSVQLRLAVDCQSWIGQGEEIASNIPNQGPISDWLVSLDEECNGIEGAPGDIDFTLTDACLILDIDATDAIVLYNDIFRMYECPGDWSLF